MIVVGKTDVFERNYKNKFKVFAGQYGEIVNYEHDRGARDIGLHLTHKLQSGKERLSISLCWFQLKGIMETTLSDKDYTKASSIKLSIKISHLQYWYLQPMPTYLVVYIECADKFLILDVQNYVVRKWGKSILKLKEKTATIELSKKSILDNQAIQLLLTKSSLEEWRKVLETNERELNICLRDYNLIWHIATAEQRECEHWVEFMDWISKCRAQLYIKEKPLVNEAKIQVLREHWQFMMNIEDLESFYPYIQFTVPEDNEDIFWFDGDEDELEPPQVTLSNGDVGYGENCSGEYNLFRLGIELNEIGAQMFEWIKNLESIGLLEIKPGEEEVIDIAPWHRRDV